MIEVILLIIGLVVGIALGYYIGRSKTFQSADLSQQSTLVSGLTTQIAEMKGKFTEIEKSRDKLEEEKEKRLVEILESSKKSDEEKEKRIKEEKEIALKKKDEQEKRIRDENRRLKEWEIKFDQEQKIKENNLIQKFYSDQSMNSNKKDTVSSSIDDIKTSESNDFEISDSENNKNN